METNVIGLMACLELILLNKSYKNDKYKSNDILNHLYTLYKDNDISNDLKQGIEILIEKVINILD